MNRLKLIVGIVFVLLGGLWVLQGSNMLAGSAMSGQSQWLIIGAILALVGIGLIVWSRRPSL